MTSQSSGCDAGTVRQWVSVVGRFSSQYDDHRWCASTVIGPPRVYPQYGDMPGTWAPKTVDKYQFLELEFEELVFVTGIEIYETYHAGAVKAVKGRDDDRQWITLWEAETIENITNSRIFSPPLKEMGCRTRYIRLEVDCSVAHTWVEIDAVRLKGTKFLIEPPPRTDDLISAYRDIVNDRTFSDVTFTFGSQSLYAHKAILCARSDYFKNMFASAETKESTLINGLYPIEINDVDCDTFLAMLHYIYTNTIPDKYDSLKLTGVWRAAEKFKVGGLQNLASYLIITRLNESNVVDTYVAATNSWPVNEAVRDNCLTYIHANMSKTADTGSFEKIPQSIMADIIQQTTAKLHL